MTVRKLGRPRLSVEKEKQILECFAEGFNQSAIARETSVSRASVARVLKRAERSINTNTVEEDKVKGYESLEQARRLLNQLNELEIMPEDIPGVRRDLHRWRSIRDEIDKLEDQKLYMQKQVEDAEIPQEEVRQLKSQKSELIHQVQLVVQKLNHLRGVSESESWWIQHGHQIIARVAHAQKVSADLERSVRLKRAMIEKLDAGLNRLVAKKAEIEVESARKVEAFARREESLRARIREGSQVLTELNEAATKKQEELAQAENRAKQLMPDLDSRIELTRRVEELEEQASRAEKERGEAVQQRDDLLEKLGRVNAEVKAAKKELNRQKTKPAREAARRNREEKKIRPKIVVAKLHAEPHAEEIGEPEEPEEPRVSEESGKADVRISVSVGPEN